MKKTFKTIGIYLGVLLLAFIATVVFCGAFLFFYREGDIFGIKYVKYNKVLYARSTAEMLDMETIEVDCQSYDVRIVVNSMVDKVSGAMRNKVFGYAHKSKALANFTLNYDKDTKTASFSAVEPQGWLNKKDCYVEIVIPEDLADDGFNIIVNTKKGDVLIGGSKKVFEVGRLDVSSTRGEVTVSNTIVGGDIKIDIGSGWIGFDNSCKTTNAVNAEIKLGSGVVNFTQVDVNNFKLNIVEIKSIKSGRIGIYKLKELVTNGNINSGGRIEVKEVEFIDFSSLDTDLIVYEIKPSTMGVGIVSRINLTGLGDCSINNVYSNLQINGNDGNLVVGTAIGSVSLITDSGNITMNRALKLVSADTQSGNINITFDKDALNYAPTTVGDANKNRAVIASTNSGTINISGLQNGHINAGNKGKIALNYNKVVGDNVVIGKSGRVDILVPNPSDTSLPDEYAFNLTVNSRSASDIKVGVVDSVIGGVDWSDNGLKTFTNIYGTAGSNNLNVNTDSGIIKIRSGDLIKY